MSVDIGYFIAHKKREYQVSYWASALVRIPVLLKKSHTSVLNPFSGNGVNEDHIGQALYTIHGALYEYAKSVYKCIEDCEDNVLGMGSDCEIYEDLLGMRPDPYLIKSLYECLDIYNYDAPFVRVVAYIFEHNKFDPKIIKSGITLTEDAAESCINILGEDSGYLRYIFLDQNFDHLKPSYEDGDPQPHPFKDSIQSVKDHIKPSHYKLQSGRQLIDVIYELGLHQSFNLGNALKYIARAGSKVYDGESDKEAKIRDLKKAVRYLEFEINHTNK